MLVERFIGPEIYVIVERFIGPELYVTEIHVTRTIKDIQYDKCFTYPIVRTEADFSDRECSHFVPSSPYQ